jgi:hypothetical protein
MSQFYFDPKRETEPMALPDAEAFYVSQMEVEYNNQNLDHADEYTITKGGWYYWSCFPGCLPDGEPNGPFNSEKEAIKEAQNETAV